MRKLVTGMSINRGFTLIEILIVIVIIGITMSFAFFAFGDFGEERRIIFAAEQLANSIRLAQQQAILESSTLGLRITNTNYQIVPYQNYSTWNYKAHKGIYKTVSFPSSMLINLKTTHKITNGEPAIIIDASGDMTPFILSIGSTTKPIITILNGSHNGKLTFSRVSAN